MRFERVAVAAIVVGALGVGAILLFGPRNDPADSGRNAAAIVQAITPSEYPYSSLAILRQPRTGDDVLPAYVSSKGNGESDGLVPGTIHHLVTSPRGDGWIALDAAGMLCLLDTTPGVAGISSVCSTIDPAQPGPGTTMAGFGAGKDLSFQVISDGTPATGEVEKGFRQIAPNIWFKGRGRVVPHPQADGDPFAYPRVEPYRSFEILRRTRTAADRAPDSLSDSSSSFDTLRVDQFRYAGSYRGSTIWVTVDTKGQPCLLVDGDGTASACGGADSERGPGTAVGIGAGKVFADLVPDGHPSRDDIAGKTKIAPNVWVGTESQ